MSAKNKREPASVTAQSDVVVTLTVRITAKPEAANTGYLVATLDFEGPQFIVNLMRAAHAGGDLDHGADAFISAVCQVMAPADAGARPISVGPVGRA